MSETALDLAKDWRHSIMNPGLREKLDAIPADAAEQIAKLTRERDDWKSNAIGTQSAAAHLDVHLRVARKSIKELDEQIVRLNGWLNHIIWVVCPSDASTPTEMACANAAANALEGDRAPPEIVKVPNDGLDFRYPAHPEVAARIKRLENALQCVCLEDYDETLTHDSIEMAEIARKALEE